MKRLVAACLLGLALASAPTAAYAQWTATGDAANDVWDSSDNTFGWWNPDLSKVRIDHNADRLVATVRFYRLDGRSPYDSLDVLINTDSDPAAEYRFMDERIFGNVGVFPGPSGDRKICDARIRFEPWNDQVLMSAPRSCFGNPRQVSAKARFAERMSDTRWMMDATPWTAKVRRG